MPPGRTVTLLIHTCLLHVFSLFLVIPIFSHAHCTISACHPQCFGRGARVCQRCFGTGLANVKGLLRRPEATLLVQRMQAGTLQPGDVKELMAEQAARTAAAKTS